MRFAVIALACMVLGVDLAAPGAISGQETPPDTLAGSTRPDTLALVAGRTLDTLVAELPGRVVSLDHLVSVAMDRNLTVEGARAQRQLAEAGVRVQQGTFDPTLSLGVAWRGAAP